MSILNVITYRGLIILEQTSSAQLVDGPLPNCPLCDAELKSIFPLRSGLDSFVAAALCSNCRYLIRANNAMSIRLPAEESNEAYFLS